MDYTDHNAVLMALTQSQDDEQDQREQAREAEYFCNKKDGQWEPEIIRKLSGRPKYTFDLTTIAVKRLANEIKQANFAIEVKPAGAGANDDVALVYDGAIRSIEAMSGAKHIYSKAADNLVEGGIGGWEIVQDWADTESFDQDLFIRPLTDFRDRVWFDQDSERQDRSDASWAVKLFNISPGRYEAKWPDGSKQSIGTGRTVDAYSDKTEFITVGQLYYIKGEPIELVLMSDGSVYERDDKFESVVEELKERGVTIALDDEGKERTRKTTKSCVYSRLMDGGGWLNEAQKTVFNWIPIIPVYGNYRIAEGKFTYRGEVLKLMDPQRVYNYGKSREVEEIALGPKPKFWATKAQFKDASNRKQLMTLNTNADPVQFFDADPNFNAGGPPVWQGGATGSPGVISMNQGNRADFEVLSGAYAVQDGSLESQMSGVAIDRLQSKADTGTYDYMESMEIAIQHTGRILVDAIPKVYDQPRLIRLMNEDGSTETIQLYEQVFDQETGRIVTLNDVRQGKYAVTCSAGAGFKNRQDRAIAALTEALRVMPEVGSIAADQLFKNINAPGMDIIAERLRGQMVQSGVIPPSQWTEEERMMMEQAMAQPQEPSAEDKIANAELARVQAETANTISLADERQRKLMLEEQKTILRAQEQAAKQQAEDVKQLREAMQAGFENQLKLIQTLASALSSTKDAMGADVIVNEQAVESYDEIAGNLYTANENMQDLIEREGMDGENLQSGM